MNNFDIIKFELDSSKFEHYDKFCWKININDAIKPNLDIYCNMTNMTIECLVPSNITKYFDNEANEYNSCAFLYENGVGAENNHDDINDIIKHGLGKYRFWNDSLYMSTKDNGSPKNNKYFVIIFDKNDIKNEKFTFGLNWLDYVSNCVNETVITEAGKYIDKWLNKDDELENKSVIDVGCGSGLSSLCFMRRNIDWLVSFDIDPDCIIATQKLAKMYYDNHPDNWEIIVGSILDDDFIDKIGQFDIVHSWGVLHHTGNMWKAIENTIKLVKPGGKMLISLYATISTYERDKAMKELYNRSNKFTKMNFIADYIMSIRTSKKAAGENPDNWNTLQPVRGMRIYNDIVDWLGGLPYEVTDTNTIVQFCKNYGLTLLMHNDPPSQACHEWLFIKNII